MQKPTSPSDPDCVGCGNGNIAFYYCKRCVLICRRDDCPKHHCLTSEFCAYHHNQNSIDMINTAKHGYKELANEYFLVCVNCNYECCMGHTRASCWEADYSCGCDDSSESEEEEIAPSGDKRKHQEIIEISDDEPNGSKKQKK